MKELTEKQCEIAYLQELESVTRAAQSATDKDGKPRLVCEGFGRIWSVMESQARRVDLEGQPRRIVKTKI
jgi:hypothetical protein